MEKINKIIDSLSSVEQNVMHYKRDLIGFLSILLAVTKVGIMLSAIVLS